MGQRQPEQGQITEGVAQVVLQFLVCEHRWASLPPSLSHPMGEGQGEGYLNAIMETTLPSPIRLAALSRRRSGWERARERALFIESRLAPEQIRPWRAAAPAGPSRARAGRRRRAEPPQVG